MMIDPTGLMGDYYGRDGTYYGSDDKDDQKVYVADIGKIENGTIYLLTSSIKETTIADIERRQGNGREEVNPIQQLAQGVTQGVDDALSGMATGAGNFGINTVNALTNPLGPMGQITGVPNPFAVSNLPCNNARQCSYASATEIGIGLGTMVAGGSIGGGTRLSVVPEGGQMSRGAQLVTEWLGPNAQPVRSGSDLMIQSADRTRQIRFDLVNSHGLRPHINVETFRPTYPGRRRMFRTGNEHIFPR